MKIWVKAIAVLLLVFAIPLQGMAAATRIACHSMNSMATAHGSVGNGMEKSAQQQIQKRLAPESGMVMGLAETGHGKCANCALCCMGLAPPPEPLSIPNAEVSSQRPLFVTSLLTGHIPPTPERPPRIS